MHIKFITTSLFVDISGLVALRTGKIGAYLERYNPKAFALYSALIRSKK